MLAGHVRGRGAVSAVRASAPTPPRAVRAGSYRALVPARELRRFARGVYDVGRAASPTHLHLRERLIVITTLTLVVDLVGSLLILLFEQDAKGTAITTYGDSLFWTSAQLLTVSSQLPNPLSTGGRIIDIFLELWAISAVTALAGSFGAFFHRRGHERHPIQGPSAG